MAGVGGILIALGAFLWLAPSGQAEPHPPIVIDGNEGFCEGASGVVNCEDADGSQAAPYRISGWEIVAAPSADQPCGGQVHAAIYLCKTDKHLIIEDVEIQVPIGLLVDSGAVVESGAGSGVHIVGGGNVTLQKVEIQTAGRGIHVEDFPDDHGERALPPVVVRDSSISATVGGTLSLVHSVNGHVELQHSRLDASGRINGIYAMSIERTGGGMARTFLRDVDVEGSHLQAVQVEGGRLTVAGSRLSTENAPLPLGGPADGFQATVLSIMDGAQVVVEDSTFTYQGTGVTFNNADSALLRGNVFQAADESVALSVVKWRGESSCDFLADYNELDHLSIVNHADDCAVLAPDNWWGGDAPQETQITGPVEVPSWAPVRRSAMADVVLDHAPPEEVGRTMILQGRSLGPTSSLRITGDFEASRDATAGRFTWEVPLQEAPLRELDLRLQACSDDFCGPPVEWTVRHEGEPLPPVPVLKAQRAVVTVGVPVSFDASGSFSPEGTPIEAYRFNGGAWTVVPLFEAAWDEPGSQTVSLDVRDADGRESQRAAVASVHVREVEVEQEARSIPAAPVVLVAVVAALAGGRRRP